MSQGEATVKPAYGNSPGAGGLSDVVSFGAERKILQGTFSFDTGYTTGGETFNISGYFKHLDAVFFANTGGNFYEYLPSSGLVKGYQGSTGGQDTTSGIVELASGHDYSALVIPFLAVGI